MQVVGKVESLWRYPVKSMRGEELSEAFLTFGGVRGDRLYAFTYSRAPATFPYLTGREKPAMLHYKATYDEGKACVETPDGERLVIDDQVLLEQMTQGMREGDRVSLLTSDRALADCYPISLFSLQTVRQLGEELGFSIDKRRFRANIYIDLNTQDGFGEDHFVGQKLRIGSDALVEVIERDQRCKMIALDPDTTLAEPAVVRQVARAHDSKAGIYGSILAEGLVRVADEIVLLS
jgi:uncharacterized protein YcbX